MSDMRRVTRSRRETQSTYDMLSRWYDVLSRSERRYKEVGLRLLDVKAGERVLDVGVGTGEGVLSLARAVGPSGRVYGIDLSERMLNLALSKVERNRFAERVVLRRGDAAALPFDADFFDALFMSFTLELFDTPEIPVVLQECRRVLRAGGRMCVVALSKKDTVAVKIYEWVHQLIPQLDCRPIFVQEVVENEGFHILACVEESMWGLPVDVVVAEK